MHSMNVLQLAEKYQKDCTEHGPVEAMGLLRATGISKELALEIGLCFNAKGQAVNYDMKQKEYRFT